ncbi:MAG: hypothetical protein SGBAC_000040 [Bacillariaceae sp.]
MDRPHLQQLLHCPASSKSFMEPSKWRYLVEGGENAIYEETPSSGSLDQLLRIRKQDLAIADQVVSLRTTKLSNDKAENGSDEDSNSYLEQVVVPLLKPYVDVPVSIQLQWSFVKALKRKTIGCGCIPNARKSSWKPKTNGDDLSSGNIESHVRAQLIPDYRRLPVTPTDLSSYTLFNPSTVLSVELKPKAGYLAFSPLVQPNHRIKYQHSRYVLKQKLCQLEQQGIRSGWSSGQVQQSHFDPLDLYSGNPKRLEKAIQELFRCPQNNLRISINKQLFLSKEKDGSPAYGSNAEEVCKEILSGWVGVDTMDFRSTMMENISNWLIAVFQLENVLQNLRRLQKLDIVDADGAILVYDRLVELCSGSHEEAQALLDNVVTCDNIGENSPLEDSPFAWSPDDTDNLIPTICHKVKDFERTLREAIPKLPSEEVLDRHHDELTKVIQSMRIPDCQYLLWNWLLSLTLNDISMFVTIQKLGGLAKGVDQALGSSPMTSSGGPGILKISRENDENIHLAYTIRIVDCDGKPSKKLRSRWKKEAPFGQLSKNSKNLQV